MSYRLDQLADEIRLNLGLSVRPGMNWNDATVPPFAYPTSTAAQWTTNQLTQINQVIAAHVPDPLWGELSDIRICRLYLSSTGPTNAQTVQALQSLIRIVREMAQ